MIRLRRITKAITSVVRPVAIKSSPLIIKRPRSIREVFFKRYPCRPAERAIAPIEEVRIARIVRRMGTLALEPMSKTGLSRKKKGRMNPVNPSFTAISEVFV